LKNYRILLITMIVIVLDQLTKKIIEHNMQLYESFPVLGDFFRITYVENTGMAFGIQVQNKAFFTVFALIASVIIMIYLLRMTGEHIIPRIAMASILGGAIGNLYDRIARGSVVDFLDTEFFDISIKPFEFLFIDFPGYSMTRWPVYNVADIAITVGMAILFIFVLFEKEHTNEDENDSELVR